MNEKWKSECERERGKLLQINAEIIWHYSKLKSIFAIVAFRLQFNLLHPHISGKNVSKFMHSYEFQNEWVVDAVVRRRERIKSVVWLADVNPIRAEGNGATEFSLLHLKSV